MSSQSQPPKGATLLFGAQSATAVFEAESGCGCKPRLTLQGVEKVSWFTDRPYRDTGSWKPQRLVRQWDSLFAGSAPNAIASFTIGNEKAMVAFEMYQPRWSKKSENLSFRLEPLDSRQRDAITGLDQMQLSEISMFIDDTSASQPAWYPNGENGNFSNQDFSGMNLSNASLENSTLAGANLGNTNLAGANLFSVYGTGISGQAANFANGVLWTANLSSSNFSAANFSSTNSKGVGLQYSNLRSADFRNAYLSQANFIGSDLTGADFTGATISGAQFYGATWAGTTCPNGSMNSGDSPCPGATPYG